MSTSLVKVQPHWVPPTVDFGYKEVVLANGQFARVRQVTTLDFFQATQDAAGGHQVIIGLALRVVTIDDVPLTLPQIMNMRLVDFHPIRYLISEDVNRINTQLGRGIA